MPRFFPHCKRSSIRCLRGFYGSRNVCSSICFRFDRIFRTYRSDIFRKIEEYDSLRPGTVDGLAGATRDKGRLCHIEKRIIHELDNGLCFPTPLVFANYMLVHVHSDEEQIRFAHVSMDQS